MHNNILNVSFKTCFEIIARCYNNTVMKEFANEIIEILKKADDLVIRFLKSIVDDPNTFEIILELLIECSDSTAKSNTAHLCKYLLSRAKIIERQALLEDL